MPSVETKIYFLISAHKSKSARGGFRKATLLIEEKLPEMLLNSGTGVQ